MFIVCMYMFFGYPFSHMQEKDLLCVQNVGQKEMKADLGRNWLKSSKVVNTSSGIPGGHGRGLLYFCC